VAVLTFAQADHLQRMILDEAYPALSDSFGILRGEEVEECAGAAPCVFDGALAGLSQQVLEFGEDLFDRV